MQAEPGLEPPFRWNAAESPALTAGLCISQGPLKETEAIPAILIRKGFNPGRQMLPRHCRASRGLLGVGGGRGLGS